MSTIDELMEGQAPGSIAVREGCWSEGDHFVPYYKLGDRWHGVQTMRGDPPYSDSWIGRTEWEIYTPPKRKVPHYMWAASTSDGEWRVIPRLYRDGETPNLTYRPPLRLDFTRVDIEID